MRRDLKIMWSSNGVWTNSGYAVFSQQLLSRMLEDGWPVRHIAFWGLEGYPVDIDMGQFNDRFRGKILKTYPRMEDPYGSDGLVLHGKEAQPDVTFTMQDIWTLNTQFLPQIKNWIPYMPIDKDPAPAIVVDRFKFAYRLMTFSQFGHDTIAKAGYASTLIVEGTDTSIFKPEDKIKARQFLGLPPNAFIFGMIAANKENPPRKGWEEALSAFAEFEKTHPDAFLYIHIQQQSPTGFPVQQFARHIGIAQKLIFLDPYKSVFGANSHFIRSEMNSLDVLLHPSQTEGFGLTPVEAMSCGVPAIVGGNTSQPEMIIEGKTGWIAPVSSKRYTADMSYVYRVDVPSLVGKMNEAYDAIKKDPKKISDACREHIVKKYNMDTLYKENWKPFLERIQEEILGPKNEKATLTAQ